jgi:hypothetical protein
MGVELDPGARAQILFQGANLGRALRPDLEAFQRRVADWMGDRTQASKATALGISLPTLRKLLAGAAVRSSIRAQVEEKLG